MLRFPRRRTPLATPTREPVKYDIDLLIREAELILRNAGE